MAADQTFAISPRRSGAGAAPFGAEERAIARRYLWGVLALALAIRVVVIVAGPYAIHADEIFQYYEQAHRLAFGSGVVPWEFHDGARSWLIPGILAAIMTMARQIGSDPICYIDAIRVLCAMLSLTVVYAGFELARRRAGVFTATLTGTLCAVWIDPVFFAPSVMAEVFSGYCCLAAFVVADTAIEKETPRQLATVGALLGLAVCLRVQLGPALLIFTVLRCGTEYRRCWLPLLAGGAAVGILDLGILDFLTWGSPFHSVWHYLWRGLFEKFGGGYAGGADSLYAYARLMIAAWTPLALPLAMFAVIGASRVPLIGVVLVVLVGTHALFANVEYRYLCGGLLLCPILMGIGAGRFCDLMRRIAEAHGVSGQLAKIATGLVVAAYAAAVSCAAASSGVLFRTLDRNILDAFLAAHRQPQLCGLAALGIGWAEGWAYAYLDRDVPLYGAQFSTVKAIGTGGTTVRQSVVLHGWPLPTYSDEALTQNTALYNFLVAPPGYLLAGFTPVECFGDEDTLANPKVCLYRRRGGCVPPPAP